MKNRSMLIISLAMAAGCTQAPATIDNSQRINAGVNILPAAVLASQKQAPSTKPTSGDEPDLVDVIQDADPPQNIVVEVLRKSGLVPMLQQEGPYTMLAPTDEAFGKLPPGVLDRLLLPAHHAELVEFVKFHLLKGRIDQSAMVHTDGQVSTLAGPKVVIKATGDKVMVQDANIIRSDSTPSNGAVHWIDSVLIPPT